MLDKYKVLIVDDETSIRNLLKLHLEISGYSTFEAKSATEGLMALETDKFNLILLDLGLPDMDGLDVLKKVRVHSDVPIIIMTVRNQDYDKVAALDSGANDYIVKPFSLEELKARVRAALRKATPIADPEIYTNGKLEIDFSQHKVSVGGNEIKLTVKEFDFLKLLALQTGKLVSRNHILTKIWGSHIEDKGHYLRIYVSQLRKKLNIDGLIDTDPGVGYRLNYLD